ncbi:hypothetical protein N0V88_007306 [Collariella sp. IMI 366227]|nr:hypothetical protein N0V88_007306 [Collariella sp. IMI 366227]
MTIESNSINPLLGETQQKNDGRENNLEKDTSVASTFQLAIETSAMTIKQIIASFNGIFSTGDVLIKVQLFQQGVTLITDKLTAQNAEGAEELYFLKLHQNTLSPTNKFGFHATTCDGDRAHVADWEDNWAVFFCKLFLGVCALDLRRNKP